MRKIEIIELDANLLADLEGATQGWELHEVPADDADGVWQVLWNAEYNRAGLVYVGNGSNGATLWTDARVRSSVLGYFGHMWELYTMWVLVPLVLATRLQGTALSWAAFLVLGAGVIGCAGGGWVAQRWGSARVAGTQLAISGLCCLAAPWAIGAPGWWFFVWLVLWGITVSGDSPQFSTLTARNAPPQAVGSVLTLTNSIGFAISIVSILLFVSLAEHVALGQLLPWLAMGPVLGLWALWPLWREETGAARA